MRALVTGGRGFAGSWLAKALLDAGAEVSSLDREGGSPSRAAAGTAGGDVGVDAATSSHAEDERASGEDGTIAVPPPDTADPAEHDAAAHPARGRSVSVADATHRALSGSDGDAADDAADNTSVSVADASSRAVDGPAADDAVYDAAENTAADDGAADRAPDTAEDQPRSAPATNLAKFPPARLSEGDKQTLA